MEENMEHLGLSRNKKIVLSVAAGLTALIVLTYLGLCIYVGGSRTVLPGVRALQVELGGMTREDAVPALDAWVEQAYADAEYDLRCADTTARLSGGIA